ncbi:Ribonuclease D [Aquisphaera giovannonii]|uniref:Ribonuclease D n=1 Tax=Aquisphaera giovannonii TaxID=406548 RepID=A0A5B9WC92_9BACT|nr:HRDC domain-containing protein [Aquisphaera giovannonii]QEH38236.1 Ribonuclease D [Aquisphaera giovannonii]
MEEDLISTPAQLRELAGHIRDSGRFGFDTEFVSEDTFEPVLCLIQVATRERLAVIDPIVVGDLSPFWEVVLDPAIEVVMHAAGEDLRICHLRTGSLPARVYDVQVAAGLVGYSYPLSLVNLVSQSLRISLAGSETRTDWRRRPLSPAQLRYALDDVRYLLQIADDLDAELAAKGRAAWAEEEFAGLLRHVARRSDEDRWRRLPGLNSLNRRALEAARRLAAWREDEARHANRPLRHVLRDDLLVAIAKRLPASRRDLEALRDFNRPALLSKSQSILAVIEQARLTPEDMLPEFSQRFEDGPGASTVASLLSAALGQWCVRAEVATSLVATVGDLKHLIRWHLDGRPDDDRPSLMTGWRGELCGQMLLEVLEGRRTFRVVDPGSEFPVAVEPSPRGDAEGPGSEGRP